VYGQAREWSHSVFTGVNSSTYLTNGIFIRRTVILL